MDFIQTMIFLKDQKWQIQGVPNSDAYNLGWKYELSSVCSWGIYLGDELSVIASYEIYTEWNLISNLNVHQIGTFWISIKINGCN